MGDELGLPVPPGGSGCQVGAKRACTSNESGPWGSLRTAPSRSFACDGRAAASRRSRRARRRVGLHRDMGDPGSGDRADECPGAALPRSRAHAPDGVRFGRLGNRGPRAAQPPAARYGPASVASFVKVRIHRHVADQGQPVREQARPEPTLATHAAEPELSVVMPCLNESDTLGSCIEKAQRAMAEHGIDGEVIVADNGSTDGSRDIAESLGARVVPVTARGYGSALMGAIAAARGRYILMGDADDSYDFQELPAFVAKLREGNDLVQGCRLERGGGRVLPGAMPFLHRRWGNPMF